MFAKKKVVFFAESMSTDATHFCVGSKVYAMTAQNAVKLPKSFDAILHPTQLDLVEKDDASLDMITVSDILEDNVKFARFPAEHFKAVEKYLLEHKKLAAFYVASAMYRRLSSGVYFEITVLEEIGITRLVFFDVDKDLGAIGTVYVDSAEALELRNSIEDILQQFPTSTPISVFSNSSSLPLDFETLFAGYLLTKSKTPFSVVGSTTDHEAVESALMDGCTKGFQQTLNLTVTALALGGCLTGLGIEYKTLTESTQIARVQLQQFRQQQQTLDSQLKTHSAAVASYYAAELQPDWTDVIASFSELLPSAAKFSDIHIERAADITTLSWTYEMRIDLNTLVGASRAIHESVKASTFFKTAKITEHLADRDSKKPFITLSGKLPKPTTHLTRKRL